MTLRQRQKNVLHDLRRTSLTLATLLSSVRENHIRDHIITRRIYKKIQKLKAIKLTLTEAAIKTEIPDALIKLAEEAISKIEKEDRDFSAIRSKIDVLSKEATKLRSDNTIKHTKVITEEIKRKQDTMKKTLASVAFLTPFKLLYLFSKHPALSPSLSKKAASLENKVLSAYQNLMKSDPTIISKHLNKDQQIFLNELLERRKIR